MNAFVLFYLWLKARFGFLTIGDFHNLTSSLNKGCGDFAAGVLRVFFTYNIPGDDFLSYIYSYDDNVKKLYLDSVSRGKRQLSEAEKFHLVNFMPFADDDVFPCSLNEDNLMMLCHLNRTIALCAYARRYVFPENIEKKLTAACIEGRKGENASSSFENVLKVYLQKSRAGCFASEESQQALFEMEAALGNHSFSKIMAEKCTMRENKFTESSLARMINRGGYEDILKVILLNSFIEPNSLHFDMEKKYPSLKWNLKISILRRALAKHESEFSTFSLTEAYLQNEQSLFVEMLEFDSWEQSAAYFREKVVDLLDGNKASPKLCAYVVYNAPELAEKAYLCVRATVEAYKKALLDAQATYDLRYPMVML
ncbi:MAG: hypothetical protein IJ525_03545 [Alphaproteobacteria bacterium]|nr:hypothetical protein [Alphaproteobacteria bacterium]